MFSPPQFSFVMYGLRNGTADPRRVRGTMVHKQFSNGYWFMEGVDAEEPGLKRQYGVYVKFSCLLWAFGFNAGACAFFGVPFEGGGCGERERAHREIWKRQLGMKVKFFYFILFLLSFFLNSLQILSALYI